MANNDDNNKKDEPEVNILWTERIFGLLDERTISTVYMKLMGKSPDGRLHIADMLCEIIAFVTKNGIKGEGGTNYPKTIGVYSDRPDIVRPMTYEAMSPPPFSKLEQHYFNGEVQGTDKFFDEGTSMLGRVIASIPFADTNKGDGKSVGAYDFIILFVDDVSQYVKPEVYQPLQLIGKSKQFGQAFGNTVFDMRQFREEFVADLFKALGLPEYLMRPSISMGPGTLGHKYALAYMIRHMFRNFVPVVNKNAARIYCDPESNFGLKRPSGPYVRDPKHGEENIIGIGPNDACGLCMAPLFGGRYYVNPMGDTPHEEFQRYAHLSPEERGQLIAEDVKMENERRARNSEPPIAALPEDGVTLAYCAICGEVVQNTPVLFVAETDRTAHDVVAYFRELLVDTPVFIVLSKGDVDIMEAVADKVAEVKSTYPGVRVFELGTKPGLRFLGVMGSTADIIRARIESDLPIVRVV